MTDAPVPGLSPVLSVVRPGRTVAGVETVDRGNRKRTTIVRFADADPIVVQRTPRPSAARLEARLVTAIDERTPAPVAVPLASGVAGGEGWLATPLVVGRDLHETFVGLDAATQRSVADAFGRYLAALHEAFRFDRYGPVALTDDRLHVPAVDRECGATGRDPGAETSTTDAGAPTVDVGPPPADEWHEWFARFAQRNVDRLPSAFDPIRPALSESVASLPDSDAPASRLFPWDLRPGNALVDDGTVTALLDWEQPLAAAPALSVAKTEYLVADWYVSPRRAADLREAFREGYTSVRAWPTVKSAHRVAAIASAAVDSRGVVTNPGYPPVGRASAIDFHARAFERVLDRT
ncbi:phosphotransferase [Halobellus sp. Atlit-31R]|nr:phosphotransferase [Halobellus sp. Atlit-31R]